MFAALALLPAACAPGYVPTTMIDPRADRTAIGMGLDSRDFENAAAKTVQDMLESGAVSKPSGGRYVLAISRVTNDTMQRIDTDLLVKRIRVELLRSGKVVTTTAVGLDGPEDPMAMRSRQLRASGEFNQANVARRGQMVAPELSLSGKLLQTNNRLGDGSQRVDYNFQLTLTDIRTGLGLWEGNEPIAKRGSNQTVAW
ncbi:MAG: penicillin-binding protein activator LpoB [Gemmatimonadaceae bacterium]|nr:penicillin-binding protein activator LpoB [Acetobacteraceae bacterium]